MADHDPHTTYPRPRDLRAPRSSGLGMALLVGGLLVAFGFILWLAVGANQPSGPAPATGDSAVTVDPPAAEPAVPAVPDTGAAPEADGAVPPNP